MRNIEKERFKMMKRNLFLCLFTMVLMTTSVAAQRSGRAGPDKMSGPEGLATEDEDTISLGSRCCPVIPPRRVLVKVLELSEEQLKEVGALAKSIGAAVGPLRHELMALARAFREEHRSDAPDATELGEMLLDIKEFRAEICALTQSFAADFADILGEGEQLEKWEAIKERFCNARRRRGPGRGGPGQKGENSEN